MKKYAKRFVLSLYRTVPEDTSDYVIMPTEEYEKQITDLNTEIAKLKEKAKTMSTNHFFQLETAKMDLEHECEDKIAAAEKKRQDDLASIKKYYNRQIEAFQRQLNLEKENSASLQEELQIVSQTKDRLITISKERANSERDLRPKKEHPGYLILQSQQTEVHTPYQQDPVMAWKSRLQTPYTSSLQFKNVKDEIVGDLVEGTILQSLGIIQNSLSSGNNQFQEFYDDKNRSVNGAYRIEYRADFSSGFWIIEIYHTQEIIVHDEMIPEQGATKAKKTTGKNGKAKRSDNDESK